MHTVVSFITNILCTSMCLFIVRVLIVYLRIHNRKKLTTRVRFVKIMLVLGSGGHTFEMFQLIRNMSERYKPRIYVIADSDSLSKQKVKSFEQSSNQSSENHIIETIPRSREVAQSWVTTIFTTLRASIYAFFLVWRHKPDCIICNGPGTCVPLCISAFLLHVLGVKHIKIIFVESICRVHTMSLSGKILYYISDYFLIQWPELKSKYPRAKYIGKLI